MNPMTFQNTEQKQHILLKQTILWPRQNMPERLTPQLRSNSAQDQKAKKSNRDRQDYRRTWQEGEKRKKKPKTSQTKVRQHRGAGSTSNHWVMLQSKREEKQNGGKAKSTVYVHNQKKRLTEKSNRNPRIISKQSLLHQIYLVTQSEIDSKIPTKIPEINGGGAKCLQSLHGQSDASLTQEVQFYQTV